MKEIFDSMTVLDATFDIWKLLLRIGCAFFAGFLLGLESWRRAKEAGVKTHSFLCMTACLLTIISKYGFYDVAGLSGISYDASRIAASILPGLCFLGAGIVLYRRSEVRGLTTATVMFLAITIGICFGAGLLITAAVTTIFTILMQFLMHCDAKIFHSKHPIMLAAKIKADQSYLPHLREIYNIETITKIKYYKDNGESMMDVEFKYSKLNNEEEVLEIASKEPQIVSIEKI